MIYHACIGVLWVSLTACFGQSILESMKDQSGASSNCQEALVTCVIPVALPYRGASGPVEALEIARNMRLGEHCRRTRKTFTCLRGLIGEDQCSDLDPGNVRHWKLIEPILGDAWTYICRTEFKKFSIHFACLLTEEVIVGITETCSSVSGPSEGIDCVGGVIKEECGSTASQITKTLFESVTKQMEAIMKSVKSDDDSDGDDDNDDDEEQQSTLPENVYARQLNILKKLLKRK